ncbi:MULTISPECIES: DUF805 domain-containing protein [Methylomonas]|uniref:DUF805 domain-containing protein n=2 Tax=Methylomonas TaxID=416 RepID=A0A126T2P2_9GAMM|nr:MULTISPECIES: DUF805 domain-containing protein [Methylomonas]AMK76351.1 hypothetical protein JT25_007570 [Methylomonas denitrificans]OAI00531.1 hypothetical protein A1342_14630 [Methylomonas methanica]
MQSTTNYSGPVTNGRGLTFTESVSGCFSKAFVFTGRASRAEYWWFALFTLLVSMVAGIIDQSSYGEPATVTAITNLLILFPSLAVNIRRLHDTGHSGWWYLIILTIIGIIPYFIWMVSKGDDRQNEYGAPV